MDVLRDQSEVRGPVLEEPRGQQRFLARSLATADVEEEPEQERDSGGHQRCHEQPVAVGLEDPEHEEEHADRRQERAERIERTRRVRWDRIRDPAAEQHDQRDHEGLKDECGPPTDRGRDQPADQWSCGGADAAHPADDPERAGTRGEIAEPQRREDVHGRDQQRRADALQYGVTQDQHAEPRSHRAQQRADAVQHQTGGEAALATPAIGQLAARDHEDRHDQQEQRDRRLDALDRRIQVLRDVVDHHVHVRAREAADELRERKRSQEPSPREHRARRRSALGHVPTLRDGARAKASSMRRTVRVSTAMEAGGIEPPTQPCKGRVFPLAPRPRAGTAYGARLTAPRCGGRPRRPSRR